MSKGNRGEGRIMIEPIKAEGLCRVKGCPAPNDPSWHQPHLWCGHATTSGMHQHVPKRGSGGHNPKSKIKAFLCESCTKKIDEGSWSNAMLDFPGVGRFWRIWDIHDNTIFQRLIEPREETDGTIIDRPHRLANSAERLHVNSIGRLDNQEIPREEVKVSAPRQGSGLLAVVEPRQAPAPQTGAVTPVLTLPAHWQQVANYIEEAIEPVSPKPALWEEWIGKVQTLANAIAVIPWAVGDLINEGEERFGEMAWQYLDTLGIDHARLSNYAWIAKTFPPTARVEGLRWSHHREVAALPAPERTERLTEALEQNMTTRELHAAIKGEPKPTLRRCLACGHVGPLSEFPKEER